MVLMSMLASSLSLTHLGIRNGSRDAVFGMDNTCKEGKVVTHPYVPGRPAAPTLLEAGPTRLHVNWSATQDNGAYLIGYRLRSLRFL